MTVLALAATLVVVVASVLFGAYNISAADALHTLLTGGGSKMDRFFVLNQRLPRAVAAVLVGAMLALSGACFPKPVAKSSGQSRHRRVSRPGPPPAGCSCSCWQRRRVISRSRWVRRRGFVTAGAVALVSRRGGVGGDNLVLTGVAISEMLSAANS